ncbi:hypothetical protein PP175_06530 [Aneurinibacillus sp. Ricciae_BoGa-3]|uniref:hypothetical protein n=1 Tax=Aneurinibacillus sp. Ricciae_BoGa-3 TaxID=3022697 RepID=UPI002340D73F|nr:hypothetical protein [Aneurinibacillus sp. Ricciae_BoGa-3]WCK55596.1 hypothetical protein PP175_06530 [Aneurinibacillus sp. Ricciae_BoGa-3]
MKGNANTAVKTFISSTISLNKSVINSIDPVVLTLNFKADETINLESSRLAVYPIGKQVPSLSAPIPEWSHISFNKGDVRQKKVTILPSKIGLRPGYYVVKIEYLFDNTAAQTSADLLIQYPPGTIKIGKINVNKTVQKEGYTLTLKSITMYKDKVIVDTHFSPSSVGNLLPNMKLDDGTDLKWLPGANSTKLQMNNQQFTFSPIPKSAKKVTFSIPVINVKKTNGTFGIPGPWSITMNIPK